MPNEVYRSLNFFFMYYAVSILSVDNPSFVFLVILKMEKDIDTLKGPINILGDDRLFDVSMY